MQINLLSEGVETYENAVNNKTKIFEMTTPDGLQRLVEDRALLVMKLRDSSGDEIAGDTKIVFGIKEPINEFPSMIDQKSYLAYRNTSFSDQTDNTKNEHMRLEIDKGGVVLKELESFSIWIVCPDVVDWDQSEISLNDVKEKSA